MIEQRVTLRYGAQQIPAIVQAVQGDTGRDVIFELADYEIPAGATANYYIDKPDGNAIYNSAEVISSTEILAHLTEQALAAPGRNNGQVRILSDGEVITSFDFVLEVAAFRGILHLQSETEINIFDAAIQEAADDAIEEIQAQTPVVTGMQSSIAPTYSSSSTYAVGDYVMYNAQLYKCVTAITTAEAWTAEHWTQVPLATDVSNLKSTLDIRLGETQYESSTNPSAIYENGYVYTKYGVHTALSDWKCWKAEVNPLSRLTITGSTYYSVPFVAIFDANDNVIEYYPTTEVTSGVTLMSDQVIIAPINTSYIIVNNYLSRETKIVEEKIMPIEGAIKELAPLMMDDYVPIGISSFTNSGYFDYRTGEAVAYSGWHYIQLDVEEGEEYKITGYPWLAIKTAIVTDASDNVLASYPPSEQSTRAFYNAKFAIPKNGTKMYLNYEYFGGSAYQHYVSCYKKVGAIPSNGKTLKMSIIGDSLSGAFEAASIRYLNLLEAHDNYVVENLSRSGCGYKRDDDNLYAFWRQAQRMSSDTDVCLIFGSFNDLSLISSLGSRTDSGTSTICGCINQTIDNIFSISRAIKIGVVLPTPWTSNRPYSDNSDAYINAIIEICEWRGIPYLDLYHRSQLQPWNSDFCQLYYYNADGTHPNNAGHLLFIYPHVNLESAAELSRFWEHWRRS